jgi:hypothetical protein
MSDIKISELPEVGSLISTDITPFVASGTTSKIRLSNLANTMPNVPSATSSSYSLTSSYSNYAVTSSVASRILGGVANYIPIWYTDTTLDSSQLYQLSNNIIIGGTTNPDNYKLYVIGSAKFTNGLNITGSVKINNLSEVQQTNIVNYNTTTGQLYYQNTGSFTASYSISSSYAQTASYSLSSSQAITASFITASNVLGPFGRNSILSASYSLSSSNAQTASYILNAVSSSYSLSSSFAQTASYITTAQTASFITASNVLGPFGRNSILSASYSVSSSNAQTASYAFTSSFSDNFKATNLSLGTNPINVTTGYGNYISTVTYPIATEASTFWIKIISIDNFPQRIKLFIQAGSDNTLAYDEFEIATSGYGMPHHILRKPTTRYNESKIVGILTSNLLNTAIQEVWINVLGTADSNSYQPFIFMYSNVSLESLANMQASRTTTKPTKANGGTELIINNDKRTNYTIQTSAGAEFNGPVAISGSLNAVNGITGSLLGTASYALNAVSSSYALTSSYSVSSSFAQTASFVTASNIFGPFGRNSILSASYSVSSSNATTASYVVTAQTASYILNAVSASYSISASNSQTASYILNAQTASYITTAQTASYVLNAVSASYSITSSYATTASNVLGGTTNFVTKWNSNTSLGSSLIYDNGTNIGIGTTSPDSLLSLEKANINNVSLFKIKAHGGPTPSTAFDITYLNDAGVATISYYGGNQSKIVLDGGSNNAGGTISVYSGSGQETTKINGSFQSWIASGSGNVGIGTNTPAYKLDILGSLKSSDQVLFTGLSNISKSNIIGFDPNNGQLYYQTTASLLPNTASYSITSSLALNNIITASADSTYLYFTKGDGSTFNVSFPTVGTATNADTASFVTASNVWGPFGRNSIVSASYSVSSSNAQTASYIIIAQTASYVLNAQTASYVPTLQQVTNQGSTTTILTNFNSGLIVSSSLKITGSFVLTGSATITGSITASGDLYLPANLSNIWIGSNNYTSGDRFRIHLSASDSYIDFANGDLHFRPNGGSPKTGSLVLTNSGNIKISGSLLVTGSTSISRSLAVGGISPSNTVGRIDASNDIVAFSTSDIRLKENINIIQNPLNKVLNLEGIEFDWKESTKDIHGHTGSDIGIIAQQVLNVIPQSVRINDTGYYSVRYEKLIPLLIEAIKEQQNQINELKEKINGITK